METISISEERRQAAEKAYEGSFLTSLEFLDMT